MSRTLVPVFDLSQDASAFGACHCKKDLRTEFSAGGFAASHGIEARLLAKHVYRVVVKICARKGSLFLSLAANTMSWFDCVYVCKMFSLL